MFALDRLFSHKAPNLIVDATGVVRQLQHCGISRRAAECPEVARLRNPRRRNRCRLSELLPTSFAPSETFGM
jgi:hypothetical protein